MKKILAVFSAIAILFSVVACKDNDDDSDSSGSSGSGLTGTIENYGYSVTINCSAEDLIKADNKTYSRNISVLASVLSADAYGNIRFVPKGISDSEKNKDFLLYNSLCFTNTKSVKFTENDFSEDSDDITSGIFSMKNCTYEKKDYSVIFVAIEGTDGTRSQWSSNFDIGADTEDYRELTGTHSGWKNKENHKGFDVAANRLLEKLESYITENVPAKSEKLILITGHSRGAAIANILGAIFEDKSDFKSFTYTFATPQTTTSAAAGNYKTIFNIMNTDDIVTELPLKSWGFRHYGRDKSGSIEASFKSEWKNLTKLDYVSAGAQSKVGFFNKICSTREDAYIFGGRTLSSETPNENKYVMADKTTHIAKLNEYHLEKYAKISGNNLEFCPQFFNQFLAELISGGVNVLSVTKDFSELTKIKPYDEVLMSMVLAGKGIEYSHGSPSYTVLAQNIK